MVYRIAPGIYSQPERPVERITFRSVVNHEGFCAAFNEIVGTEKQEEPMGTRITQEQIRNLPDTLIADPQVWTDRDGVECLTVDPAQIQRWAEQADGFVAMQGYAARVMKQQGRTLHDTDRVVYGADGTTLRILRTAPVTVADDYVDVLMKDGSTQTINLTEKARQIAAKDLPLPWFAPGGLKRDNIADADLKTVYYNRSADALVPYGAGSTLPKVGDKIVVSLGAAAIGAIRHTLDRVMAAAGFQLTTGEHDICRITADDYEGAPRTAFTKELFESALFRKLLSHSNHRSVAEIRNLVTVLSEFLIDGPDQDTVSLRRKVSDGAANVQSVPHESPVAQKMREILDSPAGGWIKGEAVGGRYAVICDERNNTLADVDRKRLNVDITVALPKHDYTVPGQAESRLHRPGGPRPSETFIHAFDPSAPLASATFSGKFVPEDLTRLTVTFPAPGEPMNPEAIKIVQGLADGSVRFAGCTAVKCGDHKMSVHPFVCTDCGMTLLQAVSKNIPTCVPVAAPAPAPSHSERVAPRTHPAPTGGAFRTRASGQGLFLPNDE